MGHLHERRFPGESDAYREARDRLLAAERDLRRQTEEVAALRRSLPAGGAPKEDYVFQEGAADLSDTATVREIRLSAGAEFLVVICGDIMTMPGLPRQPAADAIHVDDGGEIQGLF